MFAPKAELTKAGQPDPHLRPQRWPPGSKPTSASFLAAANLPCPSLPGALGTCRPCWEFAPITYKILAFPFQSRTEEQDTPERQRSCLVMQSI